MLNLLHLSLIWFKFFTPADCFSKTVTIIMPPEIVTKSGMTKKEVVYFKKVFTYIQEYFSQLLKSVTLA